MRFIGKAIGYIMFWGSGILMFIFWLIALKKWLGFLGIILAFFLSPGVVIFPLVFWFVEGVFPSFYFIVWGVGLVGLFIAVISSKNE